MVIKKYVAISYCFAFLSVYLGSIAYALLSETANKTFDIALPQTTAMNSTVLAVSSFSSWGGILSLVGVVVLLLVIIFFVTSVRAMGSAYS